MPAGVNAALASAALEPTVPMPVWTRAPADWRHSDPGRPAPAAGADLRHDARLLAALVGAMTINLLPAAWAIVGRPSESFLKFGLLLALTWTLTIALQLAVLRAARARRQPALLQITATAVVGMTFSLAFSTPLNPYAERLGLIAVDAWGSGVHAAWTSVLVAVFLVWHCEGRQRQAEASQRLRSVQLAQLAARRGLVESQLQAVQARIDPQDFFDTLDAIETLYRRDVPRAEALFDELVVFLRAALPSLQSASSVLARELDLAGASVRMHALASGEDIALDIAADRSLQRLAFPPGLLLPLLRDVLRAGTGRRRVGLSVALETGSSRPASLVLSIAADRAPEETTLRQVRSTLRSLFGAAATLDCSPPCDQRITTHLRIDHERL